MKLGLLADKTEIALDSFEKIKEKYDFIDINENPNSIVDAIVILGGDGFMLHSMHNLQSKDTPLYGMNCGTIGFLLNEFSTEDLKERIKNAKESIIFPLEMSAIDTKGETHKGLAYNEVSLLRETRQSASIEVVIDGKIRIHDLVGDGILVATPAGSSAYNFSAKGPIVPLGSDLLALTPISPFRPRQWRGALLPSKTQVKFIINNPNKRPVSCVADYFEFRDIKEVSVAQSKNNAITLLFDRENPLEDKLITEQFL